MKKLALFFVLGFLLFASGVSATVSSVGTYQSDHSTSKTIYTLGDTVYGKGSDGYEYLKIEYHYSNGNSTVLKSCDTGVSQSSTINCDWTTAPVGNWKIYLYGRDHSWDSWSYKASSSFTVNAPAPKCGDGVVNQQSEQCDDGNTASNDGCSSTCQTERCGDGIKQNSEQCDDGNTNDADTCSNKCQINVCTLTVDKPTEGQWFDSVPIPIEWHLSAGCTPIDYFYISYKKDGDCTNLDFGWFNITWGSNGEFGYPYTYLWDKPATSGQYCVKVKVTSNGARDASDVFNVDLAKPVVHMSVGDNQYGDCTEGTGSCYVNQETPITLSCTDDNPPAAWQSGPDYTQYRYSVDGGEFTEWMTYSGPFSFPQDTNHVLQYKCYDKVGKESPTKEKNFVVETVAPIITKTVGEPKVSGCDNVDHPSKETCDWYINQNTQICVSTTDPSPHPVDNVRISCMATVWNTLQSEPHNVEIALDDNGCFKYKQDSYHELKCTATDALGNSADLYEADIVDSAAPETSLEYTGPYYSEKTDNGLVQWIDGVSRVVLNAVDPQPHPVDDVKTYYRNGVVDNKYCYGTAEGNANLGDTPWTDYNNTAFGMEESCHLIEYYSVDALGNTETTNKEYVFVDKTAPTPKKVVGTPSHNCNSLWEQVSGGCQENWDWIITMDTPIELSCNDEGNHPSGNKQLCWRLTYDGEIAHGEGSNEDGWVCNNVDDNQVVTVQFNEESEHKLEFYCVDQVGKTSLTDSEMFKVSGEEYKIELLKKWNLISIPFNLISDDITEVFSQIDDKVEAVWSYDADGWHVYNPNDESLSDLETIKPGYGYWVKASDDTNLVVGGSLLSAGPGIPPSRELQPGWNLIGHYGTDPKQAYCSLFSLIDTQEGYPRWSALYGYNAYSDVFESLDQYDTTYPGKGYWVEMDVADNYGPATACWGFPTI